MDTQHPDDRFAKGLRGFGPLGVLAMLVIMFALTPVISGVLVLLWAWRSHTPWREIGYVRPRSWIGGIAVGILFGVAFKFFMKAVVMPLLGFDPINQAYHYLVANTAALPGMIFAVTAGAGFGEETLYRGFLFERLRKVFGPGRFATVSTVLLTAVWFGVVHYPVQGLPGVAQAVIVGLVFGAIYTNTGRLWMLMCAHLAFDLAAVAIIYWDLEYDVAHLVFK